MHYQRICQFIATLKKNKKWDDYRNYPLVELISPLHRSEVSISSLCDGDSHHEIARQMYRINYREGQTFIWSV
jgi:hypothetical protein